MSRTRLPRAAIERVATQVRCLYAGRARSGSPAAVIGADSRGAVALGRGDCGGPLATLSKSDFKLARSCITKLHYQEHGYPRTDDDDPYLELLAEGGYMVEVLARMMHPDGIELAHGADAQADWRETARHLQAERVTLFEATLLSGRKLARVDILVKDGNHFDLIEVKSKSTNGDDAAGGPGGPFRAKRRAGGIYPLLAPWRPYLEDVAYQTLVLRTLYPEADVTPHLLLVDKSKSTAIDGLPGMFRVVRDAATDGRRTTVAVKFVGDRTAVVPGEFLKLCDVTREVDEIAPSVAASAAAFEALYSDAGVAKARRELDWACRDCEFRVDAAVGKSGFRECWGERGDVSPHVFDLYQLRREHGDRLLRRGVTSLLDVDPSQLTKKDLSPSAYARRQAIQIAHTRSGTPWVDASLFHAIDALGWPLHFIDFETSLLAIPYHAGMQPYGKVAFQWSCHTWDAESARPTHREWLAAQALWPNAEFARTLRAAVGEVGRVLTWSTYESTVLRDVRDALPGRAPDAEELVTWIDRLLGDDGQPARLFDLNALCLHAYFHPRMGKSTSIKKVLDALWHDDATMRERYAAWMRDPPVVPDGLGPYEGLPPVTIGGRALNVADGTGAMRAYQAMVYGVERDDPALVETYRKLLLRYCELDTLAMVLVVDHWRRVQRSG